MCTPTYCIPLYGSVTVISPADRKKKNPQIYHLHDTAVVLMWTTREGSKRTTRRWTGETCWPPAREMQRRCNDDAVKRRSKVNSPSFCQFSPSSPSRYSVGLFNEDLVAPTRVRELKPYRPAGEASGVLSHPHGCVN